MEMQIQIPFDTERTAEIAYHSLRVDPEPKRSGSKKELTLNGLICEDWINWNGLDLVGLGADRT